MSRSLTLAVLMVLVMLVACTDDPPTKPPVPEVNRYPFYLLAESGDHLLRYWADSGTVDSVLFPDSISTYAISADGSHIFAATEAGVVVYDTGSLAAQTIWPQQASCLVASPDNDHLALIGDSLVILSLGSGTAVFKDTGSFWPRGSFSPSGQIFACIATDSNGDMGVQSVNIATGAVVSRSWRPDYEPIDVAVTDDNSRWYVYAYYGGEFSRILVYSTQGDSMIFRHWQAPGYGRLVLKPTGSELYFNNPGGVVIQDQEPDHGLSVYSALANQVSLFISTVGLYGDETEERYLVPGFIAMSGDGKYLVGTNAQAREFAVIDVQTHAVVRRDRFPLVTPGYIDLQTALGK